MVRMHMGVCLESLEGPADFQLEERLPLSWGGEIRGTAAAEMEKQMVGEGCSLV